MHRISRFTIALVCLGLLAIALPQAAGAYTVQAGDTPQSIAKKHGVSVNDLLKANKDLKPNKMRVGDSLTIPGGSTGKNDKKHHDKHHDLHLRNSLSADFVFFDASLGSDCRGRQRRRRRSD